MDVTPVDQLDTHAERNGVQEVQVPERKDGLKYDWGKILRQNEVEPEEDVKPQRDPNDPHRGYVILGGISHVSENSYTGQDGQEHKYAGHSESIGIQQFFTPRLSYVLTSEFNEIYNGGKSVEYKLCAETSPLAQAFRIGACAGAECGYKDKIPESSLIKGTGAVPKAEINVSYDVSRLGSWIPQGTDVVVGVENAVTPTGDNIPNYTAKIRFPFDFDR